MDLETMIGKVWHSEITESAVKDATGATEVRVLPVAQAVSLEFVPDRVTVWVDKADRIMTIWHETSDGSVVNVS